MELLFWFRVCFPTYLDTFINGLGFPFDKKEFWWVPLLFRMLATAPAGCWFPCKVWRAVLWVFGVFKNTLSASMGHAWVLVYQRVWKWHFAVPVIISLYFLSFDFTLEVLVLKMSHRKQKLGFSTQKRRRVLFCWLELCQQLSLGEDSEGIICSPEVFGV